MNLEKTGDARNSSPPTDSDTLRARQLVLFARGCHSFFTLHFRQGPRLQKPHIQAEEMLGAPESPGMNSYYCPLLVGLEIRSAVLAVPTPRDCDKIDIYILLVAPHGFGSELRGQTDHDEANYFGAGLTAARV